MDYAELLAGDPAPHWRQRCSANPAYSFDTAAGRYLVLALYGSAADPAMREALAAAYARTDLFDDEFAALFPVSANPADEAERRIGQALPGRRVVWDDGGLVARLYGSLPAGDAAGWEHADAAAYRPRWVIIDPAMRIVAVIPMAGEGHAQRMLGLLAGLPPPGLHAGLETGAPVIVLPHVFDAALCEDLIGAYRSGGGAPSGFMREVDGRTVLVDDPSHKRRRDHTLTDPTLIARTRAMFVRKVVPQVAKVHQFQVTRMERYLVAAYTGEDRGHFRPHRDNTTPGTAHRRFAVSVNLNSDFDGGEVVFPEFGQRGYRAPPGGAVVFSCSLLHMVREVTRGTRFAFLPFLYDDAAARLREANAALVHGGSNYRAGSKPAAAPGRAVAGRGKGKRGRA